MSASFYDLMKYAHTGLATADMTAFDKLRAQEMAGGGSIKTLTGVPPLSFKSNGKPLISWSMLGNGVQNGTPAPDAPVDVVGCGDRTANMAYDVVVGTDAGAYANALLFKADLQPSTQYKLSFRASAGINLYLNENVFELQSNFITVEGINVVSCMTKSSIDVTKGAQGLNGRWRVLKNLAQQTVMPDFTDIMFNTGSTPLPYEPYGWKIPITCAGQTTPIYLGQTQTVRRVKKLVLTGNENYTYIGPSSAQFRIKISDLITFSADNCDWLCSHFPSLSYNQWIQSGGSYSAFLSRHQTDEQGYLRFKDTAYSTLADFIAWISAQYAAGTPVVIWYVLAEPETAIVNEPLAKIGDYADELHSTDAGVSIPTAKGANTLTVDTDLQPSSMTITYRG